MFICLLAANNFMMRYLGNYSTDDELSLVDGDEETCADLIKIWPRGPHVASYRTIWERSPGFNVSLVIGDGLSKLLTDYSTKKISIKVSVGKKEPFEGDSYGQVNGFLACSKISSWNYRCSCELQACSVFVTVTVRDRSLIAAKDSLKICEISIST